MASITAFVVALTALVVAVGGFLKIWYDLNRLAQVTADTHTLVNSQYGTSLRLTAELSRWKANQTGSTPEDRTAADHAEKMYHEHQTKQRIVDRKDRP